MDDVDNFREKVLKLLKELNKEDDKYGMFVILYNEDEDEIVHFGYGCPACFANYIGKMNETGEFKHSSKPRSIH